MPFEVGIGHAFPPKALTHRIRQLPYWTGAGERRPDSRIIWRSSCESLDRSFALADFPESDKQNNWNEEVTGDGKEIEDGYLSIEARMRELAARDGDIYLPNVLPRKRASHVFICMEPSLGPWAGPDRSLAQQRIDEGFRNFMWSMEDFILRYCIQHFLVKDDQAYHLTDISKGAMLVEKANVDRGDRYTRWFQLLKEELELVATPEAQCFAVGRQVYDFLTLKDLEYPLRQILHFSPQAVKSRQRCIDGREQEFAEFAKQLDTESVLEVARRDLAISGMSDSLQANIFQRLEKTGPLSKSRKMLAFNYRNEFENPGDM